MTNAIDVHHRFVVLREGLTIPAEAFVLLLQLESRGIALRRDGEDGLLVGPSHSLTDADRVALHRWNGICSR